MSRTENVELTVLCLITEGDRILLQNRTKNDWQGYTLPGGHVDLDRLREEVLLPLRTGRSFRYRPYDCHADRWLPPRFLDGTKSTVVEGSYSCHPELSGPYDARVFLDIAPEAQLERLKNRDADAVNTFLSTWIPREEQYFSVCNIRERCGLVLRVEI